MQRSHYLARLFYTESQWHCVAVASMYVVFATSLLLQPHRWRVTPAYYNIFQVLPPVGWAGLFLLAAGALLIGVWQLRRSRWPAVVGLSLAMALTATWQVSFFIRYCTNGSTTPLTWVVFSFILGTLIRAYLLLDLSRAIRMQ